MMDEMTAWNIFRTSGKVEDYIRFREIGRENKDTGKSPSEERRSENTMIYGQVRQVFNDAD